MLDITMNILWFVDVVAALFLIGIIMIQQSKSGGGLGALGGGMTESEFGTAAGNIITKTTVVLAAVFLGVTLALAILSGQRAEQEGLADRLESESQPMELEDVPETEQPTDEGDGAGASGSSGAASEDQDASAGGAATTGTQEASGEGAGTGDEQGDDT